jgi:hypothetical protein
MIQSAVALIAVGIAGVVIAGALFGGPRGRRWSAQLALCSGGLAITLVLLVRLGVLTLKDAAAPPPPTAVRVADFGLHDATSFDQPDPKFVGAAFLLAGQKSDWSGTYVEGDGFTGHVVSTRFRLDGNTVDVPVTGYPDSPGNELTLEILGDNVPPIAAVRFAGPNPKEMPARWEIPVAQWRGQFARLVLVDGLKTSGGWLAVGTPELSTRNHPREIPRSYGWFAITVFAVGALLFFPGLGLRIWRPTWLAGGAVFVVLPGILSLAFAGLLVWILGPARMNLPLVWWLGINVAIVAVLIRREWRGGSPSVSEQQSLGVYACVVVAALALGVLGLPMAQEWDALSTAQSRMVASPPDAMLPYRTAVYFYHQKDGRQDRALYFGNEWSVASRGPLAPLVITAAFSIFDAHPHDPPGYTLEQWPATRDGYYLARIVGILTNALVVLAGAALTTRLVPSAVPAALTWLAVAPVVAINTDFLWPKLLATAFVALAVTAIIEQRRSLAWIAALAALAYLSHPVGGLMIPPLLIFFAWQVWSSRAASDRRIFVLLWRPLGCAALIATWLAPWLAFKAWIGHHDVFLDYPLGDGRGFARATSIASWLSCRLENLWLTLVPTAFYFSHHMVSWTDGILSKPLRWTIGYAKSLPGEIGFVAFPIALMALVRRKAALLAGLRTYLLFAAFSLMVLFWGYSRDGLGRNCVEPVAVLLIIFTAAAMPADWRPWRWLLLLVALETASIRSLGIVFAPQFNVGNLNGEAVVLAAVSILATAMPTCWFFLRRKSFTAV